MEVITLTGNLLAEWTFDLDELQCGKTHRASGMSFQVGGKGINVSRILERFGVESEALGFAGGAMAKLCSQWLDAHGERHQFFPLKDGARPGVVVRESGIGMEETTFLGRDLPVSTPSWQAACTHIAASRPQWLAITGSIPGWQENWIEDLRPVLDGKDGIKVCADTYGPALADLVRLPLELVKINRKELGRLLPDAENSPLIKVLSLLRQISPVHNWIITDGPRMVVAEFSNGDIYEIVPASIEEVSPTGSGDTFLAALIHGWIQSMEREEMLSHATACATANAASAGVGDFAIPVPDCFRPRIQSL